MNLAIQFGAGNIGRGFIGGLLSKADYKVVFADINETVINKLKEDNKYKIFITDTTCEEQLISNVDGIMSTDPKLIDMISECKIITTAVGPLVLTRIAKTIADGIAKRKTDSSKECLNIIACENKVGASTFLKEEVLKHLDDDGKKYCEQFVGFPNCSVDRIVPPVTNENPLDVSVENFFEWNVEKDSIKGNLEKIEGMNLVGNLLSYVERKLFTLNTGHAITAYLGFLEGYKTIDESINDEKIYTVVKNAMIESGNGLIKKHGLDEKEHLKYIDKIINRFKNQHLKDDVLRVGREPIRKINSKDRLVNPLMTARSYDLPVDNLIVGLVATLKFYDESDAQSVELKKSIEDAGLKETLKKYCEINDENLLKDIEKSFNM